MNLVFPIATALSVLADAVAATFDGAKVNLFQNDVTPTPGTPIGDYTLATYTGNGAEAVTWLDPVINDAGEPELIGIVGEFRPTGTTVGNAIFGIIVTDTAGTGLKAAARFDATPLPMAATTDNIVVTLRVRLTPNGLVVTVT